MYRKGWLQWKIAGSAGLDDRKLNSDVAAAAVDPSSSTVTFAFWIASSSWRFTDFENPERFAELSNKSPTFIRLRTGRSSIVFSVENFGIFS